MGIDKVTLQDVRIENADYLKYIKEIYKSQRHDFMNYIQIIYAYIQLGKTNEAIESIKKTIKINKNLSNIYSLSLFHVCLYLDKVIRELNDLEYNTIIIVNNHTNHDLRIIKNECNIINYLDYIFNQFVDNDSVDKSEIKLEIEEYEESIRFLFAGNYNISLQKYNYDLIEETINEKGALITFNFNA